jgi:hypothetical protein
MNDDRHLDDLEHYIRQAPIIDFRDPQFSGAHGQKVRLVLQGGLVAVAKPEVGIGDGALVVAREVAAWVFARELRMADMLACTVIREDVPLLGGGTGRASVQVIWHPPFTPDMPQAQADFPDNDRRRAAVFDAVIAHSDRSHNWLAVPEPSGQGQHRLKLVDHGYAFDFPGRPFESAFYNEFQGQPLEETELDALRSCLAPGQRRQLTDLFSAEAGALENAFARARQMVDTGIIAL